jgi:hypothetical protein
MVFFIKFGEGDRGAAVRRLPPMIRALERQPGVAGPKSKTPTAPGMVVTS